jgi:hypothetical protein
MPSSKRFPKVFTLSINAETQSRGGAKKKLGSFRALFGSALGHLCFRVSVSPSMYAGERLWSVPLDLMYGRCTQFARMAQRRQLVFSQNMASTLSRSLSSYWHGHCQTKSQNKRFDKRVNRVMLGDCSERKLWGRRPLTRFKSKC